MVVLPDPSTGRLHALDVALKRLQNEGKILSWSSPSGLYLDSARVAENRQSLAAWDAEAARKAIREAAARTGLVASPSLLEPVDDLAQALKIPSSNWRDYVGPESRWWFLLDRMVSSTSPTVIAYAKVAPGLTRVIACGLPRRSRRSCRRCPRLRLEPDAGEPCSLGATRVARLRRSRRGAGGSDPRICLPQRLALAPAHGLDHRSAARHGSHAEALQCPDQSAQRPRFSSHAGSGCGLRHASDPGSTGRGREFCRDHQGCRSEWPDDFHRLWSVGAGQNPALPASVSFAAWACFGVCSFLCSSSLLVPCGSRAVLPAGRNPPRFRARI